MHVHLGGVVMRIPRFRKRPTASARDDDRGAVLLLTIVLLLVGSLIVGALASYSVSTLRAMPTAKSRTTRVEAVKSAVRMAMTLQRDLGPSACYDDLTSYNVNGLPVTVTCASTEAYSTGNDRYGVVTTANANSSASFTGRSGGSTFKKTVDGKLLLNAGLISGVTDIVPNNSLVETSSYQSANTPLARYRSSAVAPTVNCNDAGFVASDQYPKTPASHTLACVTEPWWNRVGDLNGAVRQYPLLPQIPTYQRDGSLATVGSCKVFYPGRYTSNATTLTLTGTNYFASGIYYFERPIAVAAGATVVVGEGKYRGCVFDTDAAYAPSAPKNHEITGKGATILLGKGATLTVASGGKLTINRRVSSASSRGSEGQAIRTVSFGVTSPAVEVPADEVKLSNGTLQPAASHEINVGTNGQKANYAASTLTPTNTAVQIDLGSGSDVLIDGYVFTPGSRVVVNGALGVSAYALRLFGGIVASTVALNVATAPAVLSNWYFGMKTEVIQRKYLLQATALVNGHTVESRSSFEVHQDKSYAINWWTVDA